MKILFIEDNLDLATSMLHLFELRKYKNIDFCNTGSEAIKKIETFKYDLIILDIILPDVDGIDILEKIKAKQSLNNDSFVVITTGITHNTLIDNAKKLGANYYLSKPYQFSNLLQIVEIVEKILNLSTSSQTSTDELNLFCDSYLNQYEINENLKGYNLIIQAFNYLIANDTNQSLRITKDIYPYLAKNNSTDITNIERNIRNALNSSAIVSQQKLTNLSFLLKMKKTYYLSYKH